MTARAQSGAAGLLLSFLGACSTYRALIYTVNPRLYSPIEWRDTIWFATDRRPEGNRTFGGERGDSIYYGYVVVTNHALDINNSLLYDSALAAVGRRRASFDQRLLLTATDSVEREYSAPYPLTEPAFTDHVVGFFRFGNANPSLAYAAHGPAVPAALLFVHGFNNSFDAAIERTAAIKAATGVPIAIAFSWPSKASVLDYVTDLEQARWAAPHLEHVLGLLLPRRVAPQAPPSVSLNVVAHSIGAQLLAWTLERRRLTTATRLEIATRIVLLEPDIDEELFARDVVGDLLAASHSVTLYGSTKDRALALARNLRAGYRRAGEVADGLMKCPPPIDCVDISIFATRWSSNHFDYLTPRSTVLADLTQNLIQDRGARCQLLATYRREQMNHVWRITRRDVYALEPSEPIDWLSYIDCGPPTTAYLEFPDDAEILQGLRSHSIAETRGTVEAIATTWNASVVDLTEPGSPSSSAHFGVLGATRPVLPPHFGPPAPLIHPRAYRLDIRVNCAIAPCVARIMGAWRLPSRNAVDTTQTNSRRIRRRDQEEWDALLLFANALLR